MPIFLYKSYKIARDNHPIIIYIIMDGFEILSSFLWEKASMFIIIPPSAKIHIIIKNSMDFLDCSPIKTIGEYDPAMARYITP